MRDVDVCHSGEACASTRGWKVNVPVNPAPV